MTATFIPNPDEKFFRRSYIKGVVIDQEALGLHWEDNALVFTQSNNTAWRVVVRENAYPWSSNRWSLSYFFDPDLSECLLFGVPIFAGLYVNLGYPINTYELYLYLWGFGPAGGPNIMELPFTPSPDYWYPYS